MCACILLSFPDFSPFSVYKSHIFSRKIDNSIYNQQLDYIMVRTVTVIVPSNTPRLHLVSIILYNKQPDYIMTLNQHKNRKLRHNG